MENKVKQQHYVPKMYLRRFAADNGRLSVWNLNEDSIMSRQRPENFASIKYFYDTNESELRNVLDEYEKLSLINMNNVNFEDEQFVEKALSRIESDAAEVLNLITTDSNMLYDKENMIKITIFLHLLSCRTEKNRDNLDYIRNVTLDHINKMNIDYKLVDDFKMTAKEIQLKKMMGIDDLLMTSFTLYENYDWYIGTVSGKIKLVVSDNPAYAISFGFNDICIPICEDKAIIFKIKDKNARIVSKDLPLNNNISLSQESVLIYNMIQLSCANRFVFGDKNSLEVLRKIERYFLQNYKSKVID